MTAPHIFRIACAGAKRNQVRADHLAACCDRLQATKAISTLLRIGMNHIERPRNAGHANASFPNGGADPFRQRWINFVWQALKPSGGKIKLNAIEFVRDNSVERFFHRGSGECFGKNAELHQTPPFTSSSWTRSPLSTERAMATKVRIAATPSSTLAPC